MEKYEVVAHYKSNQNEKRPVQPHELETHVVVAHSWVCLEQGCF